MSETPVTEQLAKQRKDFADYNDALANPDIKRTDRFGIRSRHREEQEQKKKEEERRRQLLMKDMAFEKVWEEAMDDYRRLQVLIHDALVKTSEALSASKKALDDILDRAAVLSTTGEKVFLDKDGNGYTADGRKMTIEEMVLTDWQEGNPSREAYLSAQNTGKAVEQQFDKIHDLNNQNEEIGEKLGDKGNLSFEDLEVMQDTLDGIRTEFQATVALDTNSEFKVKPSIHPTVPNLGF